MSRALNLSRKDRLIQERIHDPYRTRRKPAEPSFCPVCNAVFKAGRWQWLESWPADSRPEICQACQRIRDNYPAGVVVISGAFVRTHQAEIVSLARNHEQGERARRPLHRIIKIETQPEALIVSTTDIHLPKRIGEALHRAYKGTLNLHYDKESCFVRVNWTANSRGDNRGPARK